VSRLPPSAGENALSRALAARRAQGLEVLDLTESNPTRIGLSREVPALPASPLYDPQPRGLLSAREAVARYYAESRGAQVDPERILLTASTSEAYALLFKLLCDPGDEVLIPEPSYPLFGYLTALEGVRTAPYRLRWDGEWHLELDSLRFGERTRAVLVVSPGNPTGSFLKGGEREQLAQLCGRHGCTLISDEVFADFAWEPEGGSAPDRPYAAGARVETVAAFDDVAAFALSGLSKVCGLPQLKLGWCVASGPGADERLRALELIADTYLSVSTPVQLAAPALLEARHGFQRELRGRLSQNLAALRAARGAGAPWDVLASEGGWSAIVSVPRRRSEEEWALALLERGVLVHPGYFFDFPEGSHLVLSLLPEPGAFSRAARVLQEILSAT
jgi:aspartate/methionine/tyrosine aminotransferase